MTDPQKLQKMPIPQRLFVALDYPDATQALSLAEQLAPLGVSLKIGMQLLYAEGPALLRRLQPYTQTLFVDLKLHDIPNTVAGAVESLVGHGAGFLNIHTQGGPAMMQAAVEAAETAASKQNQSPPKLIGVTVLTSLSEGDLKNFLKIHAISAADYAVHLARQAQASGLDGVVCSAREAAAIRTACGKDFLLVTPGIRLHDGKHDDQARIMTPAQAMASGADYLVVGRPITQADNPLDATCCILDEMNQATVATGAR